VDVGEIDIVSDENKIVERSSVSLFDLKNLDK